MQEKTGFESSSVSNLYNTLLENEKDLAEVYNMWKIPFLSKLNYFHVNVVFNGPLSIDCFCLKK